MLQEFQKPVHPFLAWMTIAAVSLSSLFIMTAVLAQTETITQPAQEMMAPPPVEQQPTYQQPAYQQPPGEQQPTYQQPTYQQPAGETGMYQPQPSGEGGCAPGTVCGPSQPACAPGTVCESKPSMMGPGPEGGQMGPQGQQGPSEEQMQQMEQQRQQQQLKDMKRGLNQFIRSMNSVRKQVTSFRKRGLEIPEELSAALAKVDEIAEKIKNAQTPEEIEEVPDMVEEIVQVVQEWMPKLPRLMAIPRMLKEAEKQITRLERAYASDERKAKNSKIDLSGPLADFRAAIDKQKALLEEIKGQVKDDPEAAMDRLEEEFFGNLDNVWEHERTIQMLLNLKRAITQIPREMKNDERLIKNLKRQKIDTTELEAILAEGKVKFEELKSLLAAKPIDIDAVIEVMEAMMELKQSFGDKVEELTGGNEYMPMMPEPKEFKMNIPQGFMKEGPMPAGEGGPAF